MRIIPAILANNLDDFRRLVDQAETFCDYVQLDFMDGRFVPSSSVKPDELLSVTTSLRTEAHLMVEKPEKYLPALAEFGTERVHVHFEAVPDPGSLLEALEAHRFEAGLAVNPETGFDAFEYLLDDFAAVLFLTVNPGFYGSPFIPEVLARVKELKERRPGLDVGVDGGVNLDTVQDVKLAGPDFACVGSAIFNAADPAKNFYDLTRKGGFD